METVGVKLSPEQLAQIKAELKEEMKKEGEKGGVVDIKQVPHSPHTSYDLTEIYNPLSKDFVWTHNGKPYILPAGKTSTFPEFLAYHFAKHLAKTIVYGNFEKEIAEKSKGQITPDTAKACPAERVEKFKEALLKGKEALMTLDTEDRIGVKTEEKPESSVKKSKKK